MHLYSCRLCTRISRFPVQYSKLTLSHNSRNPAKMTKNPSLIRSPTCRLFRAENVFSGSFFHIVGTDNGIISLESFDMESPLETLVCEVIRTDDKNTTRVKICTVCAYKPYPFFPNGSTRRASMKGNTSSVVGFVVAALNNTSTARHDCYSIEATNS